MLQELHVDNSPHQRQAYIPILLTITKLSQNSYLKSFVIDV